MDEKELIKISQSPEFLSDLSKINRWELLPHLFRVKGKPYSLKGREQFSVLFDNEFVREKIVLSGRQEGKCGKITKKDDFLTLRDSRGRRVDTTPGVENYLSVSSEYHSKSVRGTIKTKMSPGIKPILKITTEMGNILQVTAEHKIRTFDGYIEAGSLHKGSRIASLRKCYEFGDSSESEYRIALTAYLIGDGHIGNPDGTGTFELTATPQIEEHVRSICRSTGEDIFIGKTTSAKVNRIQFRSSSPIRESLTRDGLSGRYSYEKFIPDWVFDLNKQDTQLFVESLWSTDGNLSVSSNGLLLEYATTSPLLAVDLRALLSKFGIATSIRVKKTGYRKNGVYHPCRDAYIIRVYGYRSQKLFLETFHILDRETPELHDSLSGQNDRSNRDTLPKEGLYLIGKLASYMDNPNDPGRMRRGQSLRSLFKTFGSEIRRTPKYPISRFKLEKYLAAFRMLGLDDKPEYARLIEFARGDVIYDRVKSIEPIGEYPTFDIEVDGYHNFIHNNICVHNSMSLSRSAAFDLLSIPNFQILYVAPLQEQARRFSDLYLNEAFKSCPLMQHLQRSEMTGVLSDAKIINATFHKTIANGSGIQLGYAQTSADRLRGIMCDALLVDEAQSVCADAVPIVQESLTSSEYGTTTYTGTAMVVENFIESKWQKSSMCEWVMKCEGCGVHNIPNLDGHVLSMIQADGMHCYHCGKKLNVRNGQWVAAYPNRMKSFRGYHIPQVVCPFIVENQNNWDKLLHKLMNGVLATFIQENLGISYSVGQRLLTQADIVKQCCLPDTKYLQEHLDRYSFTVAGIDWGGSELQSFTVITVIGVRPDGRLDVLWWKRYRGFDPDDQLVDIAKICRYYNVVACCADLGMGMDKNRMLVKRFGLPVTQMMYTRQLKLFGKNRSNGASNAVQCWTIDKVMALDTLFLSIKNGRIFFPKDFHEVGPIQDLLSPYESTTEVGGIDHRIYLRSEGQPDDFCHALCFASMAAMRLMGMSVDDMIPDTAFGGGMVSGRPEGFGVNPYEE